MRQAESLFVEDCFQNQREGYQEASSLLERAFELLGARHGPSDRFLESLPVSANDTTGGSETELQAAVMGRKDEVDLPLSIEHSNYYSNVLKRIAAGDTPKKVITDLEQYLNNNSEGVWENSWVRFPRRVLSSFANQIFESDLLADKRDPRSGQRSDVSDFVFHEQGEELLRMPVSYLIKLSLADVLGSQRRLPRWIRQTGTRLMSHFLNDNTSPETFSFHTVPLRLEAGLGRALARETSKRFLLTQLLLMYANDRFGLRSSGQEAWIYFSPHPPIRQKLLNGCISDSFYRKLFMSPCLSGWDKGESKRDYMHLCHQVLSRSQWNAVAKLREAGILSSDLVALPNLSNISLANNGTHISLGSLKLTRCLEDRSSGFTQAHEKYVGDLVIKIAEHFLPLFVGTYSAAPYRLDYSDFRPEKVLGFLPHELDYTHLRMIWRRWKKKASLNVFGQPVTPTGLKWLDRTISGLCGLKGDFIPDFRLIDYLVSLMSTDQSAALDGELGNQERIKRDLSDLGIFDLKMSLYLLYRLREFSSMGFSGFEGRHYSLFESLEEDMGTAANLQILVTALAFKYVALGNLTHLHIPDDPSIESERRQIFFGAAIGIPTFYVRKNTGNLFLKRIVERTKRLRPSHRYPRYLRVYNMEFQRSLVQVLLEDASDLIEMLDLRETIRDLQRRLEDPGQYSVFGKLTKGIMDEANIDSPMKLHADEFNRAAESYYRNRLRIRHVQEGFGFLEEDLRTMVSGRLGDGPAYREALRLILKDQPLPGFLLTIKEEVVGGRVSVDRLRKLINLLLMSIHDDIKQAEMTSIRDQFEDDPAPVYRAG